MNDEREQEDGNLPAYARTYQQNLLILSHVYVVFFTSLFSYFLKSECVSTIYRPRSLLHIQSKFPSHKTNSAADPPSPDKQFKPQLRFLIPIKHARVYLVYE